MALYDPCDFFPHYDTEHCKFCPYDPDNWFSFHSLGDPTLTEKVVCNTMLEKESLERDEEEGSRGFGNN